MALKRICIKVVPDSSPSAEGVWRAVWAEEDLTRYPRDAGFRTQWDYLATLCPEGHHCAAITHDLACDGRPGGWLRTSSNTVPRAASARPGG